MFHRTPRLRLFALWIALAGVLLRGLIPAGFMPGWTQAGEDGSRTWLMICPAGDLQALIPQDPHSKHHHHHPGMVMTGGLMAGSMAGMTGDEHLGHRIGEAHLGCPFAAAAMPGLPDIGALPLLPAGPETFRHGLRPDGFVADFLRRRPAAHDPPRVLHLG